VKLKLAFAFAVLLFATLARADSTPDTYEVVGQTNFANCASVSASCSPITYSLSLVAQDEPDSFADVSFPVVLSLSGEINGIAITGSGGVLYDGNQVGFPLLPVTFTSATGQQGNFDVSYLLPPVGNVALNYGQQFAYVNWNIVQTQEPPLFWYLCASIVALFLFRRYVWAG
jgi:hypothetical protein